MSSSLPLELEEPCPTLLYCCEADFFPGSDLVPGADPES